jgi:hypothetical protein
MPDTEKERERYLPSTLDLLLIAVALVLTLVDVVPAV